MLKGFPRSYEGAVDWGWAEFEPYALELQSREITTGNLSQWLADESQFLGLIHELNGRLSVAVDQDNTDQHARDRLAAFREQVWSKTAHLMNQLERKLIDTNLTPPNYDIQLQRIRTNLEIYHPDNVALEAGERSCRDQYENIRANIRFEVNGQEHSVYDILRMLHIEPDRAKREFVYREILEARTGVTSEYDTIWKDLFTLRQQIAHNAGMPDYRAYMWQKLNRHDYTPRDVIALCEAIENVVVPVVALLRRQQAEALGVDSLKPWDSAVDVQIGQLPRPYHDTEEWLRKSRTAFHTISPRFARHFDTMQAEGLLDLESRPNKSPWNYAEWLPASNRSFIFVNGRGSDRDLFMLFHEFGHAVQLIEMSALPYIRQKMLPEEIGEVASTTMELLASDQLTSFYAPEQARAVRRHHLSSMLARWPFAAMVALFQHWAYTHPKEGADPSACDHYWLTLCERFVPDIDYAGFEDDLRMQWREVFQVFAFPFHFIEYALAQLGAVQVWENYQRDPQNTMDQFRRALGLGHTVTIPEFYALAGAKFAFDSDALEHAVGTIRKALRD